MISHLSKSDAGLLEWYALQVRPRHDKTVSRTLTAKGYETFVPTYTKRQKYSNRIKEWDLPLFPGYVFCRFDPLARLPILMTPGITQILGAGRTPLPVEEREIASLQSAIRAKFELQPYPFIQAGQKVRIAEGSLSGVEGTVVSSKHGSRLVLSVTLLQRSVLLQIDCDSVSVERVAGATTRHAA